MTKVKSPKVVFDRAKCYEQIFVEGERLGLSRKEVKEKYIGESSNISKEYLLKVLKGMQGEKDLTQHTMDEVVEWRNAAHERIKEMNAELKKEVIKFEDMIDEMQTKIDKIQCKRCKTIDWYKKLGKVISSKIKGVKFSDKILYE